jgi:hypothetical protein
LLSDKGQACSLSQKEESIVFYVTAAQLNYIPGSRESIEFLRRLEEKAPELNELF